MTSFTVRLGGGNFADSGSALFLQRANGTEIQLQHDISDFTRLRRALPPRAVDVVLLALSVYGCDRSVSRVETADGWTRQISLQMPVSEPDAWASARPIVEGMISFLTGDEWSIEFVARDREVFGKDFQQARRHFRRRTRVGGTAVSLFSGGLDSLIGVIDWLEENPEATLTLSGAYDPFAESAAVDQENLFLHLRTKYAGRLQRLTSRMGIAEKGVDSNYRSRSFCFVAFGVLAAQFLEDDERNLIVPENGSIALNYPLTPARSGSLSTRTVHPYFLQQLRELLTAVGVQCALANPYGFKTKGEMIAECRDPDLLRRAYFDSVSCGNRKRYKAHVPGATADHCGYCVPCLFRQAALHHNGWPVGDYGVRVENPAKWGKLKLSEPNQNFGATKDFVLRRDSDREVWRRIIANGRVPLAHKSDYIRLVQHQRQELENWMQALGIVPNRPR